MSLFLNINELLESESTRFATVKQSHKWISKIGDTAQDIGIDFSASVEKSKHKIIKQKKENLLKKLKQYDFLISKNLYFEEKEEFPMLQLDF